MIDSKRVHIARARLGDSVRVRAACFSDFYSHVTSGVPHDVAMTLFSLALLVAQKPAALRAGHGRPPHGGVLCVRARCVSCCARSRVVAFTGGDARARAQGSRSHHYGPSSGVLGGGSSERRGGSSGAGGSSGPHGSLPEDGQVPPAGEDEHDILATSGTGSTAHLDLATVKGHLRRMHKVLNAVLKSQMALAAAAAGSVPMRRTLVVQEVLRDVAQVRSALRGAGAPVVGEPLLASANAWHGAAQGAFLVGLGLANCCGSVSIDRFAMRRK